MWHQHQHKLTHHSLPRWYPNTVPAGIAIPVKDFTSNGKAVLACRGGLVHNNSQTRCIGHAMQEVNVLCCDTFCEFKSVMHSKETQQQLTPKVA